ASGSLASEAGADIRGTLGLQDVAATHGAHGPLLSAGSGQLSFNKTSLSLPRFDAQLMGRPFHLELAIDDFQRLDARGVVRGAVDLAQVARMRGSTAPPEGVAAFDLAFAGPARQPGALRLTGPVRLTQVTYRSESLAVPAVISSATIQLTGDGISAERIPVQLGTSDVALSLNAPGMLAYALAKGATDSPPDAEFTLTSTRLDLSEVMVESETGYGALMSARLAGKQVGGRDPGELAAEKYKLPPLPPVNARGQVRIDELINPPNRVRNLSFRLRLRDGVLDVLNLSGRSYGGRLSGQMSLDFRSRQAPFPLTYDLKLEDANAATLVQRWTRLGAPISGRTDFTIAGTAALDGTMLPTLDGLLANGNAKFREGRFEQFALTNALASQLRLDASKLSGFQDFGGGFEIKDGKFLVQGWQFLSGDFTGAISGSAGLGGSLDLALDLDIPVATLQKAGLAQGGLADLLGQLAGSDQKIDVAVGIGGTMSQPVLQLDNEAIQQQLTNMLQGQGRDLLQRLFKPPPD
ncbi:MAG TPA: AsmA-like C-terminal region-containing protein, partial [Gemmatimonadota bacterium]|nr:AsmA-like C-terminal region-containing protein [Gemmatimonadota bacterium]